MNGDAIAALIPNIEEISHTVNSNRPATGGTVRLEPAALQSTA